MTGEQIKECASALTHTLPILEPGELLLAAKDLEGRLKILCGVINTMAKLCGSSRVAMFADEVMTKAMDPLKTTELILKDFYPDVNRN